MIASHQLIHSSQSAEWFTPGRYIEAARSVLQEIDLDPASCIEANRIVRATKFYTAAQDGLKQPWGGRIFLNPPYGKSNGKSNQGIWSQRLIAEFRSGAVEQAILLCNAQTAEKWFQPLWAFPICFTDHRVRFVSPVGGKKSPTHGSVFVYFGSENECFKEIFRQFGTIVILGGEG